MSLFFAYNIRLLLFLSTVDWSGRREDSCGISWTGETPQAPTAARRLTASPAESEAPGKEIKA
ncbi:hypothetical protein G3A_00050 [Bacillus sp. 17376]|nr:hypothetical protein G3A_00050 [Bacillus sp. 17376]